MSRKANGKRPHYTLRSNVPLPTRADLSTRYPFADMKAGQSFALPSKREFHSCRASASQFARRQKKKIKFSIRFDRKRQEYGCWRVK